MAIYTHPEVEIPAAQRWLEVLASGKPPVFRWDPRRSFQFRRDPDVAIMVHAANSIALQNVTLASLSADDFHFF